MNASLFRFVCGRNWLVFNHFIGVKEEPVGKNYPE
jgi:hypothetical protein